jgi:hypothetical protein
MGYRTLALGAAAAIASLAAVSSAQAGYLVNVWGGYNDPAGHVNPDPGTGVNGAQDPAPTISAVARFTYNGPINWQNNTGNNGDDHTQNLYGEFFTPADIAGFSSPDGSYSSSGVLGFLASSMSVEESFPDTFYTYIQISGTTGAGTATISHDDGASVYTGTPGSGTLVYGEPLQTVDEAASFAMPAGNFYIDYEETNGAPSDLTFNVSGVAEPSAWAMMLLGFAGMGLAVRRKSRGAVLAA